MTDSRHPGRILRDGMARGTVMCPGAFNALVARAVADAGFESCYISGGATANVAGYPDVGFITLTEMCRTIREITQAGRLPTIVDADTGYGDGEMIIRTIVDYDRHGAAGMHVEDQVFPKRCGHLDGKSLISAADMVAKLRLAADNKPHEDFILIARTDARSVTSIEDAIERANAYRAAGADMIFPEGLQSEEEFARFAAESPGLLLANMTEYGKTPYLHVDRFAQLGYQLVIYPLSMQRLAMGHVVKGLKRLRTEGGVEGFLDEMQTRAELYEMLEYTPGTQWDYPNPTS